MFYNYFVSEDKNYFIKTGRWEVWTTMSYGLKFYPELSHQFQQWYITYTLKGNSKYLLIATPDFHTQGISVTFTLEHTKGSNIGLIILIIVAVIIVAVVVAFIICRCRRKNSY